MIERQLDRVLHVLADGALRPRQRGDEADLHRLGGGRKRDERREQPHESSASFRAHD